MQDSAAEYFGSLVAEYDSLIRRAVPGYDECVERLLAYTPPSPVRILELGCGTGNLSVALQQRFPAARLTCIDASREMLDVTRSRLAALRPTHAAELVELRFEDLAAHGETYDFVTSCISLHHVEDKDRLFQSLHARLEPAGTLLFADLLRGGDRHTHEVHWEAWLRFCREPRHCTDTELESLLEHARAHDRYVSLRDQFKILHECGFVDLDCVWRQGMCALLYATRSEQPSAAPALDHPGTKRAR